MLRRTELRRLGVVATETTRRPAVVLRFTAASHARWPTAWQPAAVIPSGRAPWPAAWSRAAFRQLSSAPEVDAEADSGHAGSAVTKTKPAYGLHPVTT
jgi:hypothetical protein